MSEKEEEKSEVAPITTAAAEAPWRAPVLFGQQYGAGVTPPRIPAGDRRATDSRLTASFVWPSPFRR